MEPTTKVINATLQQIEAAERPAAHPRTIARQAVKRWRSDAAKLKLPVSNQHDSDVPSLRVDETLNHDGHDRRLGRK